MAGRFGLMGFSGNAGGINQGKALALAFFFQLFADVGFHLFCLDVAEFGHGIIILTRQT